ncbi:sodium:solute symporter family transporter [uncultured Arcanobacterium sp.]|uniref:sodium:solute symporter family transporter n=1 Tax=uncultured Arcanobacterium sp. TaxID=487520 RepID=UPI00262BAB94|nr:hypothetical protein [uncultured Arcanobacterium sp.]
MTTLGWIILLLGIGVGGGVALIGTYIGKRQMKNSEHYFTGGRNVTMSLMTATWISYAVGTGLIFSPAESAYTSGLSAMIGYALALTVAYLTFIPISRKIRSRIPQGHTIAEYAKVRYGTPMQLLTTFVTVIYMFILLVSNLIGAALIFKYVGGIPMPISVLAIGLPTLYFAGIGGVKAAIATNGLQSLLITPLIFLPAAYMLFDLGGTSSIYEGVRAARPEFLDIAWDPSMQFAVMIIMAVTAAELLNQSLWQRIYTAKNQKTINRSLGAAAVMVFPLTIVAAFLGFAAIGLGTQVPHTSIVSGMVIFENTPTWITALFSIVVVLAASSTGGDALAGFSSIFSFDVVRVLKPQISPQQAVLAGRIGVVLFGVLGMLVAYRAPSILFLLLLADLLACAAVVPIIGGLYLRRIGGMGAFIACAVGIVSGIPMFLSGQNLWSFLTALGTSTAITLLWALFSKKEFDFARLRIEIENIA